MRDAIKIIEIFNRSPPLLDKLRDIHKSLTGETNSSVSLQQPGATRWNSYFDALKNLVSKKTALKVTF